MRKLRSSDVFINCPFDPAYKPTFEAIVFAIYDLGFVARCALAIDDASESRQEKIFELIEQSRYGIHDISAVSIDANTGLPHFNMPLELGLFLGCKRFGPPPQRRKGCLILDIEKFRYRDFISDVAGQDIHAHNGKPGQAIVEVRNWLSTASKRKKLPGGEAIAERYAHFREQLPSLCDALRRHENSLTFSDLSEMISLWLKTNR
ncbi:MAG: hypothetical protein M3Z23_06590 [Acidobacteriota bacterium]|nr:hypothetical protein [Acidobacteriota bacterium]